MRMQQTKYFVYSQLSGTEQQIRGGDFGNYIAWSGALSVSDQKGLKTDHGLKGINGAMLNTERLRIYPASREQMEAMIASEQDKELKKAYTEMLQGCLRHTDQWDWYAICMIEKTDGPHIGDLCFRILKCSPFCWNCKSVHIIALRCTMLHWSSVTHVRHGGSQTSAVEGVYAPRMSRQKRRGVLELISLKWFFLHSMIPSRCIFPNSLDIFVRSRLR